MIIVLILFFVQTINGQDIVPEIRALYVDDFFSSDSTEIILGDPDAEQALFDYAQNCGYNYLILYGLSAVPLGSQPESVEALKKFIRRAHEDYQIKLGCIGQSSKFFERIHNKYQSLDNVSAIERIDSYNLEFEFWKSFNSGIYEDYYCENYLEPNGYSCDSIGAFEFAMDELNKIDSLSLLLNDDRLFEETSNITTEIYIGWINEYHAEVLAQKMKDSIIDRILGAVYKPALEDGSLNLYDFYHQLRRLRFLGSQENTINFLPIFAVKESQGNHLRDWIDTIGSIPYVWEHYSNEFFRDTSSYINNINLQGYVWYNHSNMPLCFDTLGFEGNIEGPDGELYADSIYTFRVSNYENADRFYWELPEGTVFADSGKWGDEVSLIFKPGFKEGDSIIVRPSNRCHLGQRQFFMVNEFNGVGYPEKEYQVYYANNYLHFNLGRKEKTEFKIYDSAGRMVQEGIVNSVSGHIYFRAETGIYIIQLNQSGKLFTKRFENF